MFPEYLAQLENLAAKYAATPTGNIVFYGSSSIRLWPALKRKFPDVTIENWDFGDSNLSDCAQCIERFIVPRAPSGFVDLCGR